MQVRIRQLIVGLSMLATLLMPVASTELAIAATATPTSTPAGTATPTFTAVPTNTPVATVAPPSNLIPNQVSFANGNEFQNGGKDVDSTNVPRAASFTDLNKFTGISAAANRLTQTTTQPLAAASPVAAAQAAWQNTTSGRVIIERVILDVTTACTTGSSTLNIGTTTASSTTMSNNLLDTVACTAIATLDNISNGGTSGKAVQSLASGGWITYAPNNGDTTALVGNLYIKYIPV